MSESKPIQDVLTPFIHLAHAYRVGNNYSIEKMLITCNFILQKYLIAFQDKKTLTTILASINSANRRRDLVCLADIYEYEMTAYLKAEIENFSKADGTNNEL